MRKWPERHRMLLIVSLLLALAAFLYAYFILKPVWNEHSQALGEMTELNAKLKRTIWPSDPDRLEALLAEYRRKLDKDNGTGRGQIEDTRKILAMASSMFDETIEREYGSKADFISKASQTEYKDQFDKLDTYLEGRGVSLDPSIFGLSELSSEDENYPMLLKLWTAKAVVDCVLDSGMKIANAKLPGSKMRQSSQLKVLNAKSYYIDGKASQPYIIEYPVFVEVTGNTRQLSALADRLFADGTFLPMTQLEVVAALPGGRNPKPNKGEYLSKDAIVARIVCSSFFMPDSSPKEAPVIERSIAAPKPLGI